MNFTKPELYLLLRALELVETATMLFQPDDGLPIDLRRLAQRHDIRELRRRLAAAYASAVS